MPVSMFVSRSFFDMTRGLVFTSTLWTPESLQEVDIFLKRAEDTPNKSPGVGVDPLT